MQAEHSLRRWLSYAVWALLFGVALFLFGTWCLGSTDIPPPPLALPLPQRFLTGLGFVLWNPFTLVPLTLILTASRFLVSKLSWAASTAVTLVGFTFGLVGALWVPNPVVLWPFSVLGEHTLPELVGKLFTFHIVPPSGVSYSTDAGIQSLFPWQIQECGARFCILIIAWAACLVTIRMIDRRVRTANNSLI
jgi:hypothetical protein